MKFLVILILSLYTTCIYGLQLFNFELKKRNTVVPVQKFARITNGRSAAVGQFPYIVGLSLRSNKFPTRWCSGSLIGRNWILTAAHCTDGVQSVKVYLGATKRTSAEVIYIVPKRNILIHPGWCSSTTRNDISLIKIPTVKYSARIQPIKLPAISGSYSSYVGCKVIASGWGITHDNGEVTTNLQWACMKVISNTLCAKTFGGLISAGNICISTTCGVSTCSADSGGPLVLESSNTQVGLTSFGKSTCTRGYPAVFTRLTSHLRWIATITGIYYKAK